MTSEYYMQLALAAAQKGAETAAPNPMVGCVIVKQGEIIGLGYHHHAGLPHAEINALAQVGEASHGATMYVTLEPCCHYGRTPPCTEAIIKAGIKEIFIATSDPNPLVQGKGIKMLQAAHIKTHVGLLENTAQNLNAKFFHLQKTRQPFVISKWAMSLDGKTITHAADTRQISGTHAELLTHRLRSQVDAILIGAKTAIFDNPRLTVRHPHFSLLQQPARIVLSSRGNLPTDLKIFTDQAAKTYLATTENISEETMKILEAQQVNVLILPHDEKGHVKLSALMSKLADCGIQSILIEGGMQTHETFLKAKLVNQIEVYIAPVIIGAFSKKHALESFQFQSLSQDIHVSGTFGGQYV